MATTIWTLCRLPLLAIFSALFANPALALDGDCGLPGYPDDVGSGDLESVGLTWCPATVGFQSRSFALTAETIACRIRDLQHSGTPLSDLADYTTYLAKVCGTLKGLMATYDSTRCLCPPSYH